MIILTDHLKLRLWQRAHHPNDILNMFKEVTKLISKKKWHPYRKEKQKNGSVIYCVHYHSVNFIYLKKWWHYTLITFYQKWQRNAKP